LSNDLPLNICFGLLVALIAGAPGLAISVGPMAPQLVTLGVAVLVFLSAAAPAADARQVATSSKWLTAAAAFPALWMVFQILPLPNGIGHPIWASAAAALNDHLWGHISIDLGYTLRSLFQYFALLALIGVTCVLARQRERAETLLFTLCAVTSLMSLELLLILYTSAKNIDVSNSFIRPLIGSCAIGVILNVAAIERAVERYETRGRDQDQALWIYGRLMLLSAIGTIICLTSLIFAATFDIIIATSFGLMGFLLVVIINRLNLRRWFIAIACIAGLVLATGAAALQFEHNTSAIPLLRFASPISPDSDAVTVRMISDANWKGSGVGTYDALQSIYLDVGGRSATEPRNTVVSMFIEWGGVGSLIALAFTVQLIVSLFRGALSRGRDSFFAAGSAGCVMAVLFETFCDASLTYLTMQLLIAVVIGLGLSQVRGKSVRS